MLISGGQTAPTRRFETEIAFGPGKMTLNDGSRPHMKTPLVNKVEGGQKPFTQAAQIVINHETGLERVTDKGHDGCGEITRIRPHQGDGQGKQGHSHRQQGNGGNGFLTVGRGDEKKDRQLRPTTE